MKKMINESKIQGYVYEHDLELKVSGPTSKNPGVEFISGNLSVATDEEMLNVVKIHFTYVTATTKNGKPNPTFATLASIIEGKIGNAMEHGRENAGKVRVDTAIGLNEWYDYRSEGEPLISAKRNEGGFVHQIQKFDKGPDTRATFNVDMVITGAVRKEADVERNLPEKVTVKGYIFDFRNSLLPVEFSVWAPVAVPQALDYFENLGATPKTPVFTRVQGVQVSKTVTREITEESAFGDPIIRQVTSTQRDFVITWAQPGGYDWDDESTILASEFIEMNQAREIYLAEKKRADAEYRANRDNAAMGTTPTPASGYTFDANGF